jgi:ABC-type branched-subunit amino acid transport system ATPase component
VEQNLGLGLELADELWIMVAGEIAHQGAIEVFGGDSGDRP